ncbi:unnamed protein product [Rodentolepis nana]|uniref:DRIM domain-containing protein n=1 Tax=Rodentolepis nana TaxID=102285 RepID=A0A0R3TH28_RODNA|nr:unnamed protein product [Rodentolepis nana]
MGTFHRSENTFHFLKYKEQIKQKVRISNRRNDLIDDDTLDSYFALTLENWTHLNKSCAFAEFRSIIAPYVLSLKLIILHKDEILVNLRDFLLNSDELSAGPILDLLCALSCDLREDFYPYFGEFFEIIKNIIIKDNQDADVLNYAFNCLSHLIYFLHRFISKDIKNFLNLFVPLLCMAFVMRKIPTQRLFSLLYKLNQEQELISCNFCGTILAEILSSPDGNFHSSSVEIFHVLLALITKTDIPEGLQSNQSLLEMQENDDIALFCKNILISSLQTLGNRKLNAEALFTICKLTFSYFSHTPDSRFLILVSCCDELIGLMQDKHCLHQYEVNIEKFLFESFSKHPKIQLAELIVKFLNLASNHFNPSRLMSSVLIGSDFTSVQQISLMEPIVRHRSFEKDFTQILSDVILRRDTNEPIDDVTLTFLAKLVLIRQPPSSSVKPLSPLICLSLASGHYTPEVLHKIVNWIIQPLSESTISVDRKLCSSIILPHLSPLSVNEVRPIITGEIQSTFSHLKELDLNTEDFTKSASYLCSLYEALFSCDESITEFYIDVPFLQEAALSKRYDNLELCAILLRIIEISGRKVELSGLKADTIIPILLSPSHTVGQFNFVYFAVS